MGNGTKTVDRDATKSGRDGGLVAMGSVGDVVQFLCAGTVAVPPAYQMPIKALHSAMSHLRAALGDSGGMTSTDAPRDSPPQLALAALSTTVAF
jgi:hypothetical protein